MNHSTLALGLAAACIALTGCNRDQADAKDGIIQTKFPGQVSAGGMTSGQIMAHSSKPETNAVYGGGSPFIAGGSGGNTGGAAMGGTVRETGQGPSRGITEPSGAMQGGNKPLGDNGTAPANAPQAGVTPVGAGSAANRDSEPAAAPGRLTGDK